MDRAQLSDDLNARLNDSTQAIEQFLNNYLHARSFSDPYAPPEHLLQAIRHGSLNGGKRLRPFVVRETARLFGYDVNKTMHAAAAIECVHCYSLIHDDLPDMDNDALRRGKPTVHVQFDPATAILAGDALLTHAFTLLADKNCHPDAEIRLRLITELGTQAGLGGMIGGQMWDIIGETNPLSSTQIDVMHAMKTGAIVRCAVRMGAILADAPQDELEIATDFAERAGRIYQRADDILDVTQSTEQLGKTAGKDQQANKKTHISVHGIEAARAQLNAEVAQAKQSLGRLGDRANHLAELLDLFAHRKH